MLGLASILFGQSLCAWQCTFPDQYGLLTDELAPGEPLVLTSHGSGATEDKMLLAVKWKVYSRGRVYWLHSSHPQLTLGIILLHVPPLAMGSYIARPYCAGEGGCGRIFKPLSFKVIAPARQWLRNTQTWVPNLIAYGINGYTGRTGAFQIKTGKRPNHQGLLIWRFDTLDAHSIWSTMGIAATPFSKYPENGDTIGVSSGMCNPEYFQLVHRVKYRLTLYGWPEHRISKLTGWEFTVPEAAPLSAADKARVISLDAEAKACWAGVSAKQIDRKQCDALQQERARLGIKQEIAAGHQIWLEGDAINVKRLTVRELPDLDWPD